MKKKAMTFFAIVMVAISLGLFVGCSSHSPGSGGGAQDAAGEQLIGAWAWEELSSYQYLFEPEGFGWRGGGIFELETFEWRAEGNNLLIDLTSGSNFEARNIINYERWTYTINNNRLTITSQQEQGLDYSYIRTN